MRFLPNCSNIQSVLKNSGTEGAWNVYQLFNQIDGLVWIERFKRPLYALFHDSPFLKQDVEDLPKQSLLFRYASVKLAGSARAHAATDSGICAIAVASALRYARSTARLSSAAQITARAVASSTM